MSAPHYQIIRRPIITEKGLGVKETQHTVVFEVSSGATKTQIKEAVQQIFNVKVDDVRTASTFTLKICCTASLICVLVAVEETSNTTVCCVSFTPSPFSVMMGRRII